MRQDIDLAEFLRILPHLETDEIRQVQGSIIQWAVSDITRSQTMTFENVRASSSMLGDVRQDNVPPLLDAATALVLGDALDARSRELLLSPFASTIEDAG